MSIAEKADPAHLRGIFALNDQVPEVNSVGAGDEECVAATDNGSNHRGRGGALDRHVLADFDIHALVAGAKHGDRVRPECVERVKCRLDGAEIVAARRRTGAAYSLVRGRGRRGQEKRKQKQEKGPAQKRAPQNDRYG